MDSETSKASLSLFPQCEDLPFEIQQMIVFNLPYRDVLSYGSTFKANRKLLENEFFWKQKVKEDFGPEIDIRSTFWSGVHRPIFWFCAWHAEYRIYLKSASSHLARFALESRIDLLEKYVKLGANVDCRDSSGETPLMILFRGLTTHRKAVEWLLQNGADPNLPDNCGRTALMACEDTSTMKLLLKYGANPRAKDSRGTPIIMRTEDVSTIRVLLDSGAHPDDQDLRGFTALWYAVTNGDENRVRLLLAYGADVFIESEYSDSVAKLPERMKKYIPARGREESQSRILRMIEEKVSSVEK